MSRLPGSVLYVCSLNRVRSPMAAGLTCKLYGETMRVASSGVRASEDVDPMAGMVMQEVGVDLFDHRPTSLDEVRAEDFAVLIALSPDARPYVEAVAGESAAEVEYWPIEDPTVEEGSREQRLEAYRRVRKELEARITRRFGPPPEWE